MKKETTDNKTTIEELNKKAVDYFNELDDLYKEKMNELISTKPNSENFRRHIISTEKPEFNSWFQKMNERDTTPKTPVSKEILYKSNLYQMYDQTVEDFRECEGEIKIIHNGKCDLHIENASIKHKADDQEWIAVVDKDENRTTFVQYSDISNMRYYPSTHTLTITL